MNQRIALARFEEHQTCFCLKNDLIEKCEMLPLFNQYVETLLTNTDINNNNEIDVE